VVRLIDADSPGSTISSVARSQPPVRDRLRSGGAVAAGRAGRLLPGKGPIHGVGSMGVIEDLGHDVSLASSVTPSLASRAAKARAHRPMTSFDANQDTIMDPDRISPRQVLPRCPRPDRRAADMRRNDVGTAA
jgi:hypothetical protein